MMLDFVILGVCAWQNRTESIDGKTGWIMLGLDQRGTRGGGGGGAI